MIDKRVSGVGRAHLPGATPIRYSRSSMDSEHAPRAAPAALRQ